jgi:hypothetical protein
MGGWMHMMQRSFFPLVDWACFAAAMCTIKLEASGPFGGTEKDVWDIIERYK